MNQLDTLNVIPAVQDAHIALQRQAWAVDWLNACADPRRVMKSYGASLPLCAMVTAPPSRR